MKFRDPLGAQACVIVSNNLSASTTTLTLHPENERPILLWAAGRGISVLGQAPLQPEWCCQHQRRWWGRRGKEEIG